MYLPLEEPPGHTLRVEPAPKMDAHGLMRWACTCGRAGGPTSEGQARTGAGQHAAAMTPDGSVVRRVPLPVALVAMLQLERYLRQWYGPGLVLDLAGPHAVVRLRRDLEHSD